MDHVLANAAKTESHVTRQIALEAALAPRKSARLSALHPPNETRCEFHELHAFGRVDFRVFNRPRVDDAKEISLVYLSDGDKMIAVE